MNCENCLHYGVCKVHYSLGMLALIDGNCSNYDACTAMSGKVNCIVIED